MSRKRYTIIITFIVSINYIIQRIITKQTPNKSILESMRVRQKNDGAFEWVENKTMYIS